MIEKVVFINRCAKVVKADAGSRCRAAVVGDGKGKVGIGYGKQSSDAIKGHRQRPQAFVRVKLKVTRFPTSLGNTMVAGSCFVRRRRCDISPVARWSDFRRPA